MQPVLLTRFKLHLPLTSVRSVTVTSSLLPQCETTYGVLSVFVMTPENVELFINVFLMNSRSKDESTDSVEGQRFTVHDNGTLEISQAAKDDTGQYTCLAKNTEGTSAINATLYVKGKLLRISKVFALARGP